jgi:stearoyl-CoA desaturase (delta-9 desaturase)
VFVQWNWARFWFHFAYGFITSFGVVAGAHRLWAHRSYKANKKMQVLLMIFQSICIQNDVIEWVRDHRVHHKYSDTDADPSNSKRGFFFSHMGWLMCKKHPDVRSYGSKVDMSDIENDPLLKFQRKYYIPLVLSLSFYLPMQCDVWIFGSSFKSAFFCVCLRYVLSLHITWLTNSVAHIGTWKPYDKNIAAADSKFFGTLCYGECWHNFHHTFPFDYKVSELPLHRFNFAMAFIDFFAWIGWATDLKVASEEMVRKRALRTGDGTHPYCVEMKKKANGVITNGSARDDSNSEVYWGLGDTDISAEDFRDIATINRTCDS